MNIKYNRWFINVEYNNSLVIINDRKIDNTIDGSILLLYKDMKSDAFIKSYTSINKPIEMNNEYITKK